MQASPYKSSFYSISIVHWIVLIRLQVSVSLSSNETLPGDPVTLRVRGEKGSCVCVATVDKSLYLLKPDFQLSPDKVSPTFLVIFNYVHFQKSY